MTRDADPIRLSAAIDDELPLALVNTLSWRGGPQPKERFANARDVVDWAAQSEIVSPGQADAWHRQLEADPDRAAAFLGEARDLRETIGRVLVAAADDVAPGGLDFDRFNAVLARVPERQGLERRADGFVWSFAPGDWTVETLLGPAVWAAADLLVSPRRRRMRACADVECRWLFIDHSRAGIRRWCSMSDCGNRAKSRRHYERHRKRSGLDDGHDHDDYPA